jgi:hypothetical protein
VQSELHRFAAVCGFGDHRHPGVAERALDQVSSERVVVGDDHA